VTQFLILLGIVIVFLAIVFGGLGIALSRRQKRHGGSLTCASIRKGDEDVAGCVCREEGKQPGSCEEKPET